MLEERRKPLRSETAISWEIKGVRYGAAIMKNRNKCCSGARQGFDTNRHLVICLGHYLYVEYERGDRTGFHGATIKSPKFPPPPKYNARKGPFYQSCKVRTTENISSLISAKKIAYRRS